MNKDIKDAEGKSKGTKKRCVGGVVQNDEAFIHFVSRVHRVYLNIHIGSMIISAGVLLLWTDFYLPKGGSIDGWMSRMDIHTRCEMALTQVQH